MAGARLPNLSLRPYLSAMDQQHNACGLFLVNYPYYDETPVAATV